MARTTFPSFNEYQAVMQSPQYCFNLAELKTCSVESDLWGLPRVRSGGFALTYKLANRSSTLAVRCFHRHVADRSLRYSAISSFLKANPSDILTPIQYLSNGVLVGGAWYPITYMKWIEGDTLEAYLVKNLKNQEKIKGLMLEFLRVVTEIERLGISHGDLSHRNLMVQNGKIILVDYDGLFVPALQGKKSCELGNIHFQLPGRSVEHFNAALDRFSEIVIYLALNALSQKPELMGRFETGGEGLLFQREDFLDPYSSKVLQEMENLAGMKSLIAQFRHICTSEVNLIPRLADFLTLRPVELTRREKPIAAPTPFPVLDARLRYRLLARVGKKVTVVGRVMDIFRGTSPNGQPHVFLNFGHWRVKCFTIVLWDGALQLLEASGKAPEDYLHQWLSVTGLLSDYEHRPQISINAPGELQLLKDEIEAMRLIGSAHSKGELSASLKDNPGSEAKVNPPLGPASESMTPIQRIAKNLDQSRDVLARMEKLFGK